MAWSRTATRNGEGYIGKPLRRREDARFVRGQGLYVDDVVLPGLAWCAFVRSPHAHARIVSVSTRAAAARPGVLLTLTADDWARAGHGELTVVHPMPFGDGRPMNAAPRPAFARDKVHHVGDIVAAVVADTRYAAEDAAEAVEIAYDPLPAVTTPRDAVAPGAPLVHAQFGSNLVFEIERGDRRKTEAALASAAKVVELGLNNNRLAANPIEPRSYLCDYDAARDRYTLYATTQQPHYLRRWLSVYTLHIPEHKIRVVSPDVGGAFGVKGNFAVEVSTVVWAAQLLRRPVKWTATRTETFLSDAQARDHDTTARMGFDRDGRIVAMQIDTLAALGGYLSNFAPSIPGNSYPQTVTGLYKTPNLHLRVRGVYTNTVPVDAYRGSGRPEATWTNERLIELGARELGIDVVEMRRRNLISRADFPYSAPGGRVYDSGDPPALLDRLLTIADYVALRREQAALRANGVLLGIGLAAFVDKAGTGPSANLAKRGGLHGGWESAIVRVHSDGKVTLFAGSHSHGQGHEITFCQIAADRLGLPIEDLRLVEGDTDQVPFGNGTWGARSASVAGTAVYRAAGKVLDKARRFAAQLFECAEGDVDYARGIFRVRGTDRTICVRGGGRRRLSRRGAAAGLPARARSDRVLRSARHQRSAGHSSRRGGDRPRDRRCAAARALCRRRLRRGDQSDDRGGAGARRPGAGHRPGAHGTHRLRSRLRTASDRELSRLRHAARGRSSRVSHHLHRDAGAEQSARRQGRERERRDRRARGDRQRGDRCAVASRRARRHLADHVRNRMARAARRTAGRRANDP